MIQTTLNQVIEVTDVVADPSTTVIVPEAKAGGYIGFYRYHESNQWTQISIIDPPGTYRDYYRTPYPLVESRDKLIEEAKKAMPNGGELKIVKIQL